MKKAEVVCNPAGNQLKFPADVENFIFWDRVPTSEIEKEINGWLSKNNKVKFRITISYVDKEAMPPLNWRNKL